MFVVLLAVVGNAAVVGMAGTGEVTAAIARIGWSGACILLALSLVNYLLRFARWQLYLKAMGHPQPWRPSLAIYWAGFALTTTPGKAGEMLRSWFLLHRGVPLRTGTAAFFSERLSDLSAITSLAILGVASCPAFIPLVVGMAVVVVTLHLLVMQTRWISWMARRWPDDGRRVRRAISQLSAVARDTASCHTGPRVAVATLLSLTAWAAEGYGVHLALQWLDGGSQVSFALFTYAASMLVGAISFLPGGLGGTEAVMIGLLVWSGHEHAIAVGTTMVVRAATLWFAVVLGCAALGVLLGRRAPEPTAASPDVV